jgi:serine protease Do
MATLVETTTLAGVVSSALAEVADQVGQSVTLVYHRGGNGAGVIWRPDGQIVTNSHVAREGRAEVVLADGRRYVGIVAARHPTRDLAIIKVAEEDLPAIAVGDSATVRPGHLAIAIGHPLGFRDAVTAGVVVASGQAATEGGPRTGDLIQADVALAPGNSGGPLVNALGEVIGINTMVSGRLAFAIPSQAVERWVAGDRSEVGTVFLGVNGVATPLRRPDFTFGFVLTEVGEGTPADRAGLFVGDVIVAIGETIVTDQESIPAAVLRLKAGDAVEIRVLRGGEERVFTVVPTERA